VAGVVATITAAVGLLNLRLTRKNLEQQRELEAQRGKQQRELAQDTALQAYYEQIGKLITDKDLRNTQRDEIRELARAQTLTVLQEVDASRKRSLLAFFHGAGLLGADKPAVELIDADLRGADLRGAKLWRVNLGHAQLQDAQLQRTKLQFADLMGAKLQDADLRDAQLWGDGTNLIGVDLQRANLQGAILGGALLPNAQLRGANLLRTQLQHTKDADLQYAGLQGAQLWGANLQGANLMNTQLLGATLEGANLTNAIVIAERLAEDAPLKAPPCPTGRSTRTGSRPRTKGRTRRATVLPNPYEELGED
jgi:uncharacterized protein YjbI with pentapeptide repeats